MSFFSKFLVVILMALPISVSASTPPAPPEIRLKQSVAKAFRYYESVSPNISVPTVLNVPFGQESFSIPVFAVYNLTTYEFEPYLLKESVNVTETGSTIEAAGASGSPYAINDGNYDTYLEFSVREGSNVAEITFKFDKPIVTSSLSFTLDNFVALPQNISITADVSGRNYTVLAASRLSGSSVTFPKTTSSVWRATFGYVQPLRISEMQFNQLTPGQQISKSLRFLAQPGQSYRVYFDADRYIRLPVKEAGDLNTDKGVVNFQGSNAVLNPEYAPVDSDGDSVPDLTDNCVSVSNADQKDSDGNGRGDACEDYDRDGRVNAQDNCQDTPNAAQEDTDKDNVGDVCDDFDNRATERMPWLPWVGIGIAGIVILGLFILVFKHKDQVIPPAPPTPPAV